MSRRLIIALLVGCAGWMSVGPIPGARPLSAAQATAEAYPPFTVRRLHILEVTAGGEALRYETVFARDARGSTVEVREPIVPETPGVRIVVDLERGERIVIEPLTRSRTTYPLPDPATRQRIETARCAGTGERQSIRGVDVFRVREVRALSAGRSVETERWVAPALGCIPLSEAVKQIDDGALVATQTVEVISVSLENPSAELFAVPPDYIERAPSEVSAERARLYPDLCPDCGPPSATRLFQQDAAYFSSRR